MCSLRLHEAMIGSRRPWRPLLVKELWEVLAGRAFWTMLLLECPLIGYSFIQAIALYSESSTAALQSSVLAASLSPLDGILVPTLGAFYVTVTLLFPFVAIRVLSHEKETGTLRLLVQLPYRPGTLITTKLVAVFCAWLLASIPALCAVLIWVILGGHLYAPETLNLFFGHLLYGMLIGSIALFAASISDSAATAAIITLAFTIGSWVLDFTAAGHPGVLGWLSQLSLTQTLRSFEQGLLSSARVVGIIAGSLGFAVLATAWVTPGTSARARLVCSIACLVTIATVVGLAMRIKWSADLSEDRCNSFAAADQWVLSKLSQPLTITVRLAPEDPRYADLRRNVLAKLERTVPDVTVRLAPEGKSLITSTGDEAYGEVEYSYAGQSTTSRSTGPREILPLLYGLAGVPAPAPEAGNEYSGYPLVADDRIALPWFFAGLPLLVLVGWWWSRRPPALEAVTAATEESHEPR